jgi:predicted transcriptional regulator
MRPKSPTLTAHELELMKIVWAHASGVTVRDVYEELRKRRPIAYTTVMSSMKTLEQKRSLKATQVDRAYVCTPAQRERAACRRGNAGRGDGGIEAKAERDLRPSIRTSGLPSIRGPAS